MKIVNSKLKIENGRRRSRRGGPNGARSDGPRRVGPGASLQFSIFNFQFSFFNSLPRRWPQSSRFTTQNAGATLTEVLIAMLIMSIGIVALATLFPLSVLRSIKASQSTNGTVLRFNAESIIDLYPQIIKSPVNVAWNNIQIAKNTPAAMDPPLNSPQNYIIDPLGLATISNLGLPSVGNFANAYQNRPEHYFGNDPNAAVAGSPWQFLPRYPLTWRTVGTAGAVATLPDSWSLELEAVFTAGTAIPDPGYAGPPAIGATQIDVPGVASLANNLPIGPGNPTVRAVIFSADGSSSQARFVTRLGFPNPNSIMWTEDTNNNGNLDAGEDVNLNGILDHYPLPLNFQAIGNVRLELQDQRYTWLLTVRQLAAGVANVDVVVFFKRPIVDIGREEVLYPAVFTLGNTQVTVNYPAANKPFMKKGNFIFDANNAYWYRISNVTDNPAAIGTSSIVTLDVPANANTPANNPPIGRAMLPGAVIDVYPIGSKSF